MKDLLTGSLMNQLTKHFLQSRKIKRGLHKGARPSTRQGTSLDFSDYRAYQPGDDLRQIDWNVYARTNKHYIKRFLDEQELIISIYVDCSKSMTLIPEKWNRARALAAALGYMSLSHDDRVGVFPIGSGNHQFTYKKGRAFSNRLLQYLEGVIPGEEAFTFSESIQDHIKPRSSLSIVISDLLEPVEKIEEALKKLQGHRQELYIIQLLAPEEIEPVFKGDLQLIDSESRQFTNVTMSTSVKKQYQQRLEQHTAYIQKYCHGRGIGFIQCPANHALETIIFKTMVSKGWVR